MQEGQEYGEPFFPWSGRSEGPASPEPPAVPAAPAGEAASWVPAASPSAGSYPPPPWGPMGYAVAAPPPSPRRGRRALIYAVVAAVAAGAGAGAVLATAGGSTSPTTSTGVSTAKVPFPSRHAAAGATTINSRAVAAKVKPGIVDINSLLAFQHIPTAATGMVLSSDGLVLTNNHVVDGATHIRATLVTSGRGYQARVIGVDPAQDVALIKLQGATGLRTIQVGDSAKVRLGMAVAAIGNAGGRGGTPAVTTGAITSLRKTITASDGGANSETLHGMLQSNVPIQPGDSGGAWANSAGQVIGMTTAANTQQLGSPGIRMGFAIPIDRALSIARQIAAGRGGQGILIGASGVMGVGVDNISDAAACLASGGLSGGGASGTAPARSGALVCRAYPGTPAARAGLATGDVITAVNGQPVTSADTLGVIMRRYRPGQTISVSWVDTGGRRHTSSITLTQGPPK